MADNCPPVHPLKAFEKENTCNEIKKYFTMKFGSTPCFYARVPGRVNLIGEHVDYCGYSVLPMAIEQDIILAVGFNDCDMVKLVNFDSDKYEDFSFSVKDVHIDTSPPRWYHYFICGYKGISEKYNLQHKSFDVVVKGTIPPSAGLSSSSALVCAAALAVSYANRISISKMEIADLCAYSERYIGTQGGGMDQAIGFLAEPGTAKLIDFNPLKATNVPLPKGAVFVVCNSCVEMNKAASSQFNVRVAECKLAAKVLAKLHGLEWQNIQKLSEIPILLQKSVEEMSSVLETYLPMECYTKEDVCDSLHISDEEFRSYLSKNTQCVSQLKLNQRSKHVYEEAARVKQFKDICLRLNDVDAVQELGALMNKSHESCRDLYECSHPDLDELVSVAMEAGAAGSRLTGAGWGGCCVSLVWENKIQEFMNIVRSKYYEKKLQMFNKKEVETVMFVTQPSGGAVVYSSEM